MVNQRRDPLQKLDAGRAAAAFFARSGLARLSRHRRPSDACVLTFHGVRDGTDDDRLLDLEQHIPASLFAEVCEYLASHYAILPLGEIVAARLQGKSLPHRTVAITFDDGYESTHRLALPALEKHGLPATVFVTAGYLDRRTSMWFHRLELALIRTKAEELEADLGSKTRLSLRTLEERESALGCLTTHLKALPNTSLLEQLAAVESALGVADHGHEDMPDALRPMTWDMARQMQSGGLIEFGGHTDTHPVLARCSDDQQAAEIQASRQRLMAELGTPPKLFAYTNGKTGDFNEVSQRLVRENGFQAAFTMQPGFLLPSDDLFALPRYGYPPSCAYLEAVVSGSMARFRSLRENLGLARAA